MLEHERQLWLRNKKEQLIEDSVDAYEAEHKMEWYTHKLYLKTDLKIRLFLLLNELHGVHLTRSEVMHDALTAFLPIFPLPEKVRFVGREKFKMVLKVKKAKGRSKKSNPAA